MSKEKVVSFFKGQNRAELTELQNLQTMMTKKGVNFEEKIGGDTVSCRPG